MEDTTQTSEEENQNDSNQNGTEKTTFTLEEVEQIKRDMESNSEKGVQKVIRKNKNLETAMSELNNISNDPNHLIKLHSEKPQVAQVILDKFYNGQDIEQYKQNIDYKEDYNDPEIIKKLVSEQAKEVARQTKIEEEKKSFVTKLKMTDEETKKFEEAFEDRKNLKSFAKNGLEKEFEKAYREIANNEEMLKNLETQKAIGKNMAVGEGKGTGGQKNVSGKQNTIKTNSEYNKNFLKSQGIL